MEKKRKVRTPFFVVNPKSYLYGQESLALAKYADELAGQYDIDVFLQDSSWILPWSGKRQSG